MHPKTSFLSSWIFILADLFVVNLSFFATYIIVHSFMTQDESVANFLRKNVLLVNGIWIICAVATFLYAKKTILSLENVYRQTIKAFLLHGVVLVFFLVFTNSDIVQRYLMVYYPLMAFFFLVSRFFITYLTEFAIKSRQVKKIAIVGYNERGLKLAEYFKEHKYYDFEGFFDDGVQHKKNGNGKINGTIDNCVSYAVNNGIREIYTTILPNEHNDVNRMIKAAEKNCVRVKLVPRTLETAGQYPNFNLKYINDVLVISLLAEPLQEGNNRVKKRILDIAISFFVLIFIFSWLMPIIAILIMLDSKGPVFYRQSRMGKNNSPFMIYKFRTMKVIESDREYKQATKNDPRITRIGKYLRKFSIDEFPQFINVLGGQMSVIGPRPHPHKLNEAFMNSINSYMVRHFVKPGITGWAQVNGYRGETETEFLMRKRIEHDIWYLENWTLMLDVKIFFMTLITVFKREKRAY